MLGWASNKNEPSGPDAPTGADTGPASTSRPATADVSAPLDADASLKLQAARGDDAALLALAREDVVLALKLAAVDALASEAALKLAEREFRSHDRRVHRLAKQRYVAVVARREAGEQAGAQIEVAKALFNEHLLPINRLVELDRAWQAIDTSLLDAARRDEFATLRAQLTALTHERADHKLKVERWLADARRALASLQAACAAAAAGAQDRSHLAEARGVASAALEAASEDDASVALHAALEGALQVSAQLDAHLLVLDDLLQGLSAPGSEPDAGPAQRWRQLAPLADGALANALNQRFEQWRQAQDQAHQARRAQRRELAKDHQRAARSERTLALTAALERAEAELAAGHLADTHRHLVEIDELLHGGEPVDALRTRIDQLQAQYAQLKGWQHWAGGRARDELTLQAEDLAAAKSGEADRLIVKLSIKQQAELIDEMRARWKELDRLGGATSRALWQRFDAALRTAYEPVAAQQAVQRAARAQNLAARLQLIEALDAVPLPAIGEGGAAPDWRSLAGALDHFQTEWRKLGPLEHTVTHKARDKLVERMAAATQRLEAPLREVRHSAQLQREGLIARAKALGGEAGGGRGRDLVDKVRALQSEWQQHARAMPLGRAAENALWAEFKASIDAVFSALDAAFNARDAEFKAHGAERVALIERLEGLGADTPPSELKRTLAEVDAAWQRTGPAPRNEAVALDARLRRARDLARQHLAGSAQRSWQVTCDALADKLALCEVLEGSAEPDTAKAELAQRWPELPALPAPWEQVLRARAGLAGAAAGAAAKATVPADDLLLQLEAAFGLDSPPVFAAARRELKLQAMKQALETRRAVKDVPLTPDQWLAAALGRVGLDASQRDRLGAVIAALRRRGPTASA